MSKPNFPDAYDLANQILKLWQQASISDNDATAVKKRYKEIPLLVNTADDGYCPIIGMEYDPINGIILHVQNDKTVV
jgi:hypothetical protein